MASQTPFLRNFSHFWKLALLSLAIVAIGLAGSSPSDSSAHSPRVSGSDWFHVLRGTPPFQVFRVKVENTAQTTEVKRPVTHGHLVGSQMVMTWHDNSATVVDSKICATDLARYPFCVRPSSFKTVYSKAGATRTVNTSTRQQCLFRADDYGECWISSQEVIWHNWPVKASAERTISLLQFPKFFFLPYSSTKRVKSDDYQVD